MLARALLRRAQQLLPAPAPQESQLLMLPPTVFEGPWTEQFERHACTWWTFYNVPVYRMTPAGVSAVAAAYKAEAAKATMQQCSTFANAPSPGADNAEWEAWLTSPQGPHDSGEIKVKYDMIVPEGQLRKLLYYWQKRNSTSD